MQINKFYRRIYCHYIATTTCKLLCNCSDRFVKHELLARVLVANTILSDLCRQPVGRVWQICQSCHQVHACYRVASTVTTEWCTRTGTEVLVAVVIITEHATRCAHWWGRHPHRWRGPVPSWHRCRRWGGRWRRGGDVAGVIVTTTDKVFVHLQIREQVVVRHDEHYIHKRNPSV